MTSLLEKTFFQINTGIIVIDHEYNIVLCNDFIADQSKKKRSELIGTPIFSTYPTLPQVWLTRRFESIFQLKNSSYINWEQRPSLFDFPCSRPITGSYEKMIQNCSLYPIISDDNKVSHICIAINDATAIAINQLRLRKISHRLSKEKKQQQELIQKLGETKNQLLQSEKMASIGQLSAGVAHEINNPVGFIKSNFSSLNNYTSEIAQVFKKYHELIESLDDKKVSENIKAINAEHDIDFVMEDINSLLTESFDGINRIEGIVQSLKNFSHADTNQWQTTNIHEGLESTLKVAGHELKYIAEIEKNYGDLPLIECLPMQINQVFMNLLINAAQAIGDEVKGGRVGITTSHQEAESTITIKVEDNGKGISEEDVIKIFDPFFTTKPVGTGTGLGLSLSYNIIQEHSGTITVDSTIGKGTCFTVCLPVHQQNTQSN